MGTRAKAKTGWNGGGGGSITADQLNSILPYNQMYIPARAMNPGNNTSSPSFLEYNIASREMGFGVWVLDKSNPGKVVSFEVDLHGSQVDLSDPQFTIYPVFFQDNDDTVSGLNVEFASQCACRLIGETLDIDYDPGLGQSTEMTAPVRNRWINSGGDTSDIRNGMRITTINGSTPVSGQNNTFVFGLERHSDFASTDTYTKSILLRGAILQWKNDFNNVAQIPGVTT